MSWFSRFNSLFDFFGKKMSEAFKAVVEDITTNVSIQAFTDAIRNGDPIGALRTLGLSPAAMRPLTAEIERAFETGGNVVASGFPNPMHTPQGRTVFRFDVRDSRAEAWLREQSGRLITNISDDIAINVRDLLNTGQRDGRNPRDVALDLVGRVDRATGRRVGGVIGLTPGGAAAVQRARTELETLDPNYFNRLRRDKRFDGIVRRAIASGVPLTPDQITKITGRYADSLLQLRGETIARTEMLAALNRSEWEAVKQAAAIGGINESATQRVWDNSGDGRVRPDHRRMEGQTVGIDEPFVFPDGTKAMYPGDTALGASARETIMCRCRAKLKADWFQGVK